MSICNGATAAIRRRRASSAATTAEFRDQVASISDHRNNDPNVPNLWVVHGDIPVGLPSSFGRVIYATALPLAHSTHTDLFAQDTWHVNPKLTVVLGLRWDYLGYPLRRLEAA